MTIPSVPSYKGYRFPSEIISHSVWLYFRFSLSYRDVDELLAARGIVVGIVRLRSVTQKMSLKVGNTLVKQRHKGADVGLAAHFTLKKGHFSRKHMC